MPSTKLVEKRNELDAKRKKMAEIFKQAGDDMDMSKVKAIEGDAKSKVEAIRKMNDELTDLGKEVDELVSLEEVARSIKAMGSEPMLEEPQIVHPKGGNERKSFGKMFAESRAVKEYKGGQGPTATLDIGYPELKTLFQTSAGWAPESTRSGRLLEYALEPLRVIDLIPGGTISQDTYKYMEETTLTNNAAEVAEGGTYGEAALALTERSQVVEKVGVWLPVTDEQMEDVAGIEAYVNSRLIMMLKQRLDSQLLTGDGSTPNLLGILNKGSIQTQAKGTDPVPDAIYKAITKVRVTGKAFADGVVLHPNDWQDIRLLRTSDGIYIWGSPMDSGPERIWGLPVALTTFETENTGLVGDFRGHSLFMVKRGVDVQATNAHSDYFIKGKQAIRADLRCVLVVFRPQAFCTVTSI